jgi:hypothetical protein
MTTVSCCSWILETFRRLIFGPRRRTPSTAPPELPSALERNAGASVELRSDALVPLEGLRVLVDER